MIALALTFALAVAMIPGRASAAKGGTGNAANGHGAAPGQAEHTPSSDTAAPVVSPALQHTAAVAPERRVTVILQLRRGFGRGTARQLITDAGGEIVGEMPVINAVAATLPAGKAKALGRDTRVKAVTGNSHVKPQTLVNFDPNKMASAYNQSAKSSNVWNAATGKGVGVAVIDSGIAGGLPDFRTSQTNAASRVVETVVTNPLATNAGDPYGHGTHVAGIIAGNDGYRSASDPLFGKYAGAAPDANLISIKAGDDQGNATVLDVIYGLQFAVDHKADYNIRVVNLSLESSDPQSYKTDPLDAAVEAAWFHGIVVVAAAGNRGSATDAVKYAPGNDPYVITVGAVDDKSTKGVTDDIVPSWSSRGTTQDGFAKPDVYAPGAHIVSTLAPSSAFTGLCPSCVVSGQYIRAGGTSMAAPVISGIVADILQVRPAWTPDQVKGSVIHTLRTLTGGGGEVDALNAYNASTDKLAANAGLVPNSLIDTSTRDIDYTRSSWSRSSWSTAPSTLTAGWARSSWSCGCSLDSTGSVLPTRSSWSRSSWSTDWSK